MPSSVRAFAPSRIAPAATHLIVARVGVRPDVARAYLHDDHHRRSHGAYGPYATGPLAEIIVQLTKFIITQILGILRTANTMLFGHGLGHLVVSWSEEGSEWMAGGIHAVHL